MGSDEPSSLKLLAMRLRSEYQHGLAKRTAEWLRRRVDISGGVHALPYEDVQAAVNGGIFEVDVDASRLWWHERG